MGKKNIVFCLIIVLAIFCGAFLLGQYYDPEPFNDMGRSMVEPGEVRASNEIRSQDAQRIKAVAIGGVILLAGSLFWFFHRKSKNQSPVNERVEEEVASTSFGDWAIALLVISVGLILPVLLAVFFGFSHFW